MSDHLINLRSTHTTRETPSTGSRGYGKNEQSVEGASQQDEGEKRMVFNCGIEGKSHLARTVDEAFEVTKTFREHLNVLAKLFEPIENESRSAMEAFTTVRTLYGELTRLASSFQSVKDFAQQVGDLGKTSEPMKDLHEQLMWLADAFYCNLRELANALEPAKAVQARINELAQTFGAVGELEGRLLELAEAFRPPAQEGAPTERAA